MIRALTLSALVAAATPALAQDATLPLAPGDTLSVRLFGQPNMSGDYRIDPAGNLSIAGLGTMQGIDSFDAARDAIVDRIQTRLGLDADALSLAVEDLRPVTVGGYVATPGQFDFHAGMRVIAAIALAGGQGGAINQLSQRIQVNQERERLLRNELQLAALLVKEARLVSQFDGTAFDTIPSEALMLAGETHAQALFELERDVAQEILENEEIARRRIESSRVINAEDIAAQQAVVTSLGTQLDLVREDLARIQPLIESGNVTGARVLALRRDFADVEGLAGRAIGSLNQSKTEATILEEEQDVFEIQKRLDILSQLILLQTDIAATRGTIEALEDSLRAAGASPITGGELREGDCRVTLVRSAPGGAVETFTADGLTPLLPGDHVEVGRFTRACPSLIPGSE